MAPPAVLEALQITPYSKGVMKFGIAILESIDLVCRVTVNMIWYLQ